MKHFFLFSFLVTTCFSCFHPGKDPFLIFDPVADSVYHYTVETGWQQFFSNNSDTMWNNTTVRFSLQCVQKDDSLRTMKLVFEGIEITAPARITIGSKESMMVTTVKGKTDTINTDSDLPHNTASSVILTGYSLYHALIGDSIFVVMDKQGQVLQVNGFDAVMDRVAQKTTIEKRSAKSSLRAIASPEAIKDLLNQAFFFMPDKEISTGDQWITNFVLTSRAPLKYSNLVTVRAINGDTVTLHITSNISAKTGEGGHLYEQGKQAGTMYVHRSSGMAWRYAAELATEYKTDQYTVAKKQLLNVRSVKY